MATVFMWGSILSNYLQLLLLYLAANSQMERPGRRILDALCKEITFVGEVSKEKKLNTVYIGWRNAYDRWNRNSWRDFCHILKNIFI